MYLSLLGNKLGNNWHYSQAHDIITYPDLHFCSLHGEDNGIVGIV